MSPRAGEWRARLLLAALSASLTLALAEGGARILLRPSPPGPVDGTPISEISPTLGWTTRPNGRQRIRREDFEVTIALNSHGLRGPEIPYEAPPGVKRLALMGDSFAHGYYAEEPETVRGRLGAALHPCGVEVLNAGQPGFSTDQEWIYFDEEIQKYQPGEVVLFFYYNDLQFNVESMGTANREKPVFRESGGTLELIPPAATPSAEETTDEAPAGQVRPAPRYHHSALWAFLAVRLQRTRPDWSRALARHDLVPRLSNRPPREFLVFGPKDPAEKALVEKMWRMTAEILKRFRDDVRGRGAGFSVFYVPARFEANDDAWTYLRRRYEEDRPWEREVVRERLATLLKDLDVPLIDAIPAFRTAEKSADKAYLPVDGHWNARGNEIAFETLFPAMRRAFSCAS